MDKKQTKSTNVKTKQYSGKRWTTEIMATPGAIDDPATLTRWRGPLVPGETLEVAQVYCEENGLGFCKVIGEAV